MENLCEFARKEAIKIIHNCMHSIGLKASAQLKGYPQVWARDSMITALGALQVSDGRIINSIKASVNTLINMQSKLGCIPNNVDVKSLKANFQAYADGGLWVIIGCASVYKQTGDRDFLKQVYPAIKQILNWYSYQDVYHIGLLNIAEASDWEDLFAVRGIGLYVNVLYFMALKNAGIIAAELNDKESAEEYNKHAESVGTHINNYLWYNGDKSIIGHISFHFGTASERITEINNLGMENIFPKDYNSTEKSYYLPYISFRDFGNWFDSFGNLLSIISGVADEGRTEKILGLINEFNVARPYPIKAIYPAINRGEKDWRYYYEYGGLNLPNQYHNGGIWPFLGGFYVAALVKAGRYAEAGNALRSLAELNKKGITNAWEFNEWFHGKSGEPRGMAEQAWSAGMYIYAYECVKQKKALFFDGM